MSYNGPNRRIHTVFRTRNREYHVRSGICIAVRDRRTQVWIAHHKAIGMALRTPGEEYLGQPLLFLSRVAGVETTRVQLFDRPEKSTVDFYSVINSFCAA